MTVNVARRRNRRRTPQLPPALPATESIAIGEINQTVFDCPSCGRPLVLGTKRCPSCGTRLILGVATSKASILAGLGLAVGLLAGGVIGFTVSRAMVAAPTATAVLPSAPPAIAGGLASSKPTQVPSVAPSAAQIPTISRSALFQAISVNKRLATGATALQASLDARAFDAALVAQTLRAISGDSVFGQQLAGRLGDWPAYGSLGKDLTTFYDAVHTTAIEGLVASVRDEAAYRSAAKAMLDVLKGLSAVDAEAQSVATRIGLDISPSTAP